MGVGGVNEEEAGDCVPAEEEAGEKYEVDGEDE